MGTYFDKIFGSDSGLGYAYAEFKRGLADGSGTGFAQDQAALTGDWMRLSSDANGLGQRQQVPLGGMLGMSRDDVRRLGQQPSLAALLDEKYRRSISVQWAQSKANIDQQRANFGMSISPSLLGIGLPSGSAVRHSPEERPSLWSRIRAWLTAPSTKPMWRERPWWWFLSMKWWRYEANR